MPSLGKIQTEGFTSWFTLLLTIIEKFDFHSNAMFYNASIHSKIFAALMKNVISEYVLWCCYTQSH